jgi:hypothetical protein
MVLLELCICVWNILFTKCEIVKLYFNSWPCADYLEKKAREMGLEKLFLLTTRTADWFVQRGFSKCAADAIPERRRARINLARGSKYYLKYLNDSSPHLVGSTFSLLETSDLPQ